ncbi:MULTISPECIES: GmrSD restriction endonuclease domain-containing protein [Enterobacter cloacae complex]|jgi:uncharacterized protein with ParB-like and HNH nuclease domain|uniref:GmrSD restriction endonuclease domain-containing protein n=1 Tax=Enterobacter cloacae complex TaxID=354276 RepID=UPI001C64259A|nr:DUF262 domain-containing protein [Enterobacter kobei]MCB3737037.1 DUF262 domain-containing protein [Klebsiella pneumoniae]MBW7704706.1 DUF262 domain-containing protein [Enterobacter kobei]HCM9519018.1 DUF262 domain-containing protein [Enterobacter kobei]HCM9533274.1 DUF262 domain-containing protein [Enterobacter kobei]HEL6264698.1 DUF262 domain-containing protein [Klebsiella pneumoniae]
MKNFDSRTYSINDFVEWSNNKQLELSPKFQRKSVWNEKAKSYLMDTIVSGKPIPKIFIRQYINTQSKKTIREVIDGQQRLRTILSFVNDGFKISKSHNKKYGGLLFSELPLVDEDIQGEILQYEISTDLLTDLSDSDILDVFSRLNSYSVTLNTQEKLHANHFSEFKRICESTAHSYNDFWVSNRIITPQKILRMYDVELCSELYIAILNGVNSKKQLERFYKKYENDDMEIPADLLVSNFGVVMDFINSIFGGALNVREFRRVHLFYSLFISVYHCLYSIPNLEPAGFDIKSIPISHISSRLERVDVIFSPDNDEQLSDNEITFLNDSRRATTDSVVRKRRSEFLVNLMGGV